MAAVTGIADDSVARRGTALFRLDALDRRKALLARLYVSLFSYSLLLTTAALLYSGRDLVVALVLLSVLLIAIVMVLSMGISRYRRAGPCLEVAQETLSFPKLINPTRKKLYDLKNLFSVEERTGAGTGFVLLGFRREGHLTVLKSWFPEEAEFERFVGLMQVSLRRFERDERKLETREALTSAYRRLPVATLSIVLSLIGFFAVEKWLMADENLVFELLRLGGLNDHLVFSGEYARLATAVLLHANILHLLTNLFVLAAFGNLVEAIINKQRLWITFLASGLFASLLSVSSSTHIVSIGASGGIYGIIGAYIFIRLFLKDELPGQLWVHRPWVLYSLLLLSMAYGYLAPSVDFLAHLGGLLFGFILTFIFYRQKKNQLIKLRHEGKGVLAVLVLLLTLYGLSLSYVYWKNVRHLPEDYTASLVARALSARFTATTYSAHYTRLLQYCALHLLEEESTDLDLLKLARQRIQELHAAGQTGTEEALESLSARINSLEGSALSEPR